MQELLGTILPQGRFIYKTIMMTFFLTITYLFFRENGKKAKKKLLDVVKHPWLLLFLLWTSYIYTCTVVGRYYSNPFRNVFGSFGLINTGQLNTDLIANVLMFIPFSFLYIQAFKPVHKIKIPMVVTIGATLFFEFSQAVGRLGSFQIADIIHNIIGGAIGCGVWHLINRRKKKEKVEEDEKSGQEI